MATENILEIVTKTAGANVTNKRFVKQAAGDVVNRCDTQGEAVGGVVAMVSYGFTGTTITGAHPAPVAKKGIVIVESGAAVADNAEVMTDNVGRAITFAAGGGALAAGRVVGGSSANAAGEDLSVELYAIAQHT